MTTDSRQTSIVSDEQLQEQLETIVELRLKTLKVWTSLPDQRTDWDLEILLGELGAACLALRQLRDEVGLPF